MPWRSIRPFLLVVMAAILAVQGAFAGVAICREDSGKTNLEWANDGQCEEPGTPQIACAHEEASESHCGPCVDIAIPSDHALKSASLSLVLPVALCSRIAEMVVPLSPRVPAAPPAVYADPSSEHLRSVRLLI